MTEEKNNTHGHKQTPVWADPAFWHIILLMAGCSVFYYMDFIINYAGWGNLRWSIFYTVHDLHRALFLIPAMYAAYKFRTKGIMAISFLSFLVFLPRALAVSPYPNPLLRAFIFLISMIIMGVFLSLLLNNITKRKELEQSLWQTQNDLLRKKSEDTLRESEDKYKSLIENIPDIIFTIDIEGKITFVSRRTMEILGYESAETINMNILNFIPEEDHQRTIENLQKGMKGEKIKHFQIPMIAKSGERLFFECSFSRIYKDGAVIGAQGTAVDITERKRAEDKLVQNSQRVQALLQLSQMQRSSLKEITDFALEEAVRLTRSKIGYLAFLNKDESVLTMHSWSKSAMAECAIDRKPIIYPVVTTGLWGEAVRQRRPVITNDYAADNPLKKSYPQGHVAIKRHMNIPLFDDTRIVLVAGVGNKVENYDQGDIHDLILLMEGMWRLIERKLAEEEIKILNEELEQRVAQRTRELSAKTAELERINKVFVDRELRMRELKGQIAKLEGKDCGDEK